MRLPHSGPAGSRRPRGAGGWLALAAILMAIAAVLPGVAGVAMLGVAVVALLLAGVFGLRAQWRTVQDEGALIAPVVETGNAAAELTARLRALREEHVARVDAALDERRPDLARELTDAYIDAAVRAITDAADVPA